MPPMESPSAIAFSTACAMSDDPPAEISFAFITTGRTISFAITPAATSPHVIRPEKWPLPRISAKPENLIPET